MCRTDELCVVALVSCRNYNSGTLVVGIGNALFDILIVCVCAQAQIDDLCAAVCRIADSVADDGRAALTGGIHDTDRKDLDIDPGCAVHDDAGHVGSVSVLIGGIIVIVYKVLAAQESS